MKPEIAARLTVFASGVSSLTGALGRYTHTLGDTGVTRQIAEEAVKYLFTQAYVLANAVRLPEESIAKALESARVMGSAVGDLVERAEAVVAAEVAVAKGGVS